MRRLLTASALLALAVFTTTAVGQPPNPEPQPKAAPKKDDKKVADPTDAVIAAALANDPDVKMARAKIQLAEAELAKARLAIAQKVTLLKTTIEQQKAVVEIVTQQYKVTEQRTKAGTGSQAELLDARITLLKVQATLATAEAELKLLTGGGTFTTFTVPLKDPHAADHAAAALAWFQARQSDPSVGGDENATWRFLLAARERAAIKGPIPDRIREALDKPVKLGAKGEKVTIEKALEVFKKEAGLDVPVRGLLEIPPGKQGFIEVECRGEEMSVGAWFQLFEDNAYVQLNTGAIKYQFYVREYGLLVTNRESAPSDAPTLTEFWKQKPPAKEPMPKK